MAAVIYDSCPRSIKFSTENGVDNRFQPLRSASIIFILFFNFFFMSPPALFLFFLFRQERNETTSAMIDASAGPKESLKLAWKL